MTPSATSAGARNKGGSLEYARPLVRAGGRMESMARNVLVILLRLIGALILLGSIWITFDQLFGAITIWTGLSAA